MDLRQIARAFQSRTFRNEDDVKIHFYSDIMKPLLEEYNPERAGQYRSEDVLLAGGRTDATFQNICFELKKYGYFRTQNGIMEALRGRNEKDHGLYDYIIGNAGIVKGDEEEAIAGKIARGIGVGFDGDQFLFARFVPTAVPHGMDADKLRDEKIALARQLRLEFI